MGNIIIQHRLEVIAGNKLLVPGCEPTSVLTSPTLSANVGVYCNNTMVDLVDALNAVSGSYIIGMLNVGSGNGGGVRKQFFVLPSGPPPGYGCECSMTDWYKILRNLAAPTPPAPASSCDAFKFSCSMEKAFRG